MRKILTVLLLSSALAGQMTPTYAGAVYDNIAAIKNVTTQRSMATQYMNQYLGYIDTYTAFLNKNAKLAGTASYESIRLKVIGYKEDVAKFAILLGVPNPLDASTTVTNTTVATTRATNVTVSAPVLTKTTVTTDVVDTSYVTQTYETTTKFFNVSTTTEVVDTVITTTYYGDGKSSAATTKNVISTNTAVSETQTVSRVLTSSVDKAIASGSAPLTVDQYLARKDVSLAGTQTFVNAVNAANPYFDDKTILSQYGLGKYANWLPSTGAPVAWSRGYTGAGSTIAILDTGIDTDNTEFAGRIAATKCFTVMCNAGYETIEDKNSVGHGTHVAGIAAAALDGVGTTGVAPDATLLIGKIGQDNGYVELDKLGAGIAWAVSNGADVVNVSSEMSMDSTYRNSVVSIGNGLYYSNISAYQSLGYNQILNTSNFTAPVVQAMSGNDTVLVVAAGNQGLAFPAFPAHYATMTDADGNLALDGRVIIAGAFDISTNTIATYSNRAGTMCYDFNSVTNTCNNSYRVSDYYLMAPGTWVTSTSNNGNYIALSGTSMAAPVISGGVALIHEMWPYMSGDNVVKLLMNTADKSFAGYDVNIHGQGVMNLDTATTPQGAVGIPTTGRIDGTKVAMNGQLSVAGMKMGSLSSMMVVDDYDRNFYMDGNSLNVATDTRTVDPILSAAYDANADQYMGYTKGMSINIGNVALSANEDATNFGMALNAGNFSFGVMKEDGSFLGNVANSPIMNVQGATTAYASLNKEVSVNNTTFFGNVSVGVTDLKVGSDSMMQDASQLVSNSASVGAKFNTKNGTFGLVAALPVAINSGNATMKYASSVSSVGEISSTSARESFANTSREVNLGAFYNVNVSDYTKVSMYAEVRQNYLGVDGEIAPQVGLSISTNF